MISGLESHLHIASVPDMSLQSNVLYSNTTRRPGEH